LHSFSHTEVILDLIRSLNRQLYPPLTVDFLPSP
jgi:hypothetical protein